jgi:hypothetical protein
MRHASIQTTMNVYPPSGPPWRRLLFPVAGSLGVATCYSAISQRREAVAPRTNRQSTVVEALGNSA